MNLSEYSKRMPAELAPTGSETCDERDKRSVVHVITGLQTGGAEMMLLKLLSHFPRDTLEHHVVCILGEGELTAKVRAQCASLTTLDLRNAWNAPLDFIARLGRVIRLRPTLVQGWMYHGNLLALLIAKLSRNSHLVWNLRCSEPVKGGRATEWVRRLCVRYSHVPDYVLANSDEGMAYHKAIGYRPRETQVIPNGVDINRFRPDSQLGADFRQSLGISPQARVIGIAASVRAMKDYPNFIQAIQTLMSDSPPNTVFLAAGRGVTLGPGFPAEAKAWVDSGVLQLLGEVSEMPAFMNAIDILTLSSQAGEGFPNVIAEAMACGVPCVVTDTGDCRKVVADFGIVVPVRDPQALAAGWREMLQLDEDRFSVLTGECRRHIEDHYQIEQIMTQYADLYYTLSGSAAGDTERQRA